MFSTTANYSLCDEVVAKVKAAAIPALRHGSKKTKVKLGYVISENTYKRVQSHFDFHITPMRESFTEMTLTLNLEVKV